MSKARSRNRAVYRFRVPFLGTFLGKQKGTKEIFERISRFLKKSNSIVRYYLPFLVNPYFCIELFFTQGGLPIFFC